MKTRSERIEEFYRRLAAAPPCSTADEALALITTTLNDVENEFSGVLYDPTNWVSDGRLYPPQDDQRMVDPVVGVRAYRSRGHRIYISEDGAIRIARITSDVVDFHKSNTSGQEVSL